MASQLYGQELDKPKPKTERLYPTVIDTNPYRDSVLSESTKQNSLYPDIHSCSYSQDQHEQAQPSVSLYPTVHMDDIVENPAHGYAYGSDQLYEEAPIGSQKAEVGDSCYSASAPSEATEEILIRIPGVIVHLIDAQETVELASGDFMLVRLLQGGNPIAVFARVGDQIQWPLAKDEASVKLDDCHYFFSLRVPKEAFEGDGDESEGSTDIGENILNYGLTFAAQGQDSALQELDRHLEQYSYFSVQKVCDSSGGSGVLGDVLARETAPADLSSDKKKKLVEERSAAYWTTLAPNVEDYSGSVARAIAASSGQIIRGIFWCGDVTVEQLRWGNEFLKRRLQSGDNPTEISPKAMRKMRRSKRVSKMSEKVAVGVLSGVVKVAGSVTGFVVNSKAGKKFFSLLPGEIVLASLDAFGKVFDAVEVVGKNVLTTSSVVTTGLVSHRYGEQAAELTNEGLGAAGHMISTAWTISKIRNALNPKNALKPTTLAKSAAKTAAKAAKREKKSK
uniref:Senescence domain-containing protein n=1 Tax=Araucaria cunninghamii TaxID=56994 RepID=A0A0D6QZI8_ARACU